MRKKLYILLSFLIAFLAVQSCSKDEETTTKNSLYGTVIISGYTPYLHGADSNSFTISGVTHPDGKKLGMYIYVTVDSEEIYRDTINRIDVNPFVKSSTIKCVLPDSLATYFLYAVIYPEDSDTYYSTSSYAGVVTVDRYLTIPELAVWAGDPGTCTDPRDEEPYKVVKNGNVEWLGNSLYYAGTEEEPLGREYRNCPAMDPIVGRFYTWDEAIKACPPGWTLPSNRDFLDLAKSINPSGEFSLDANYKNVGGPMMVDAYFNGTKMWEFWPKVKIPSEAENSALLAIPIGWCNDFYADSFPGSLEYSCFWTSDTSPLDSTQAVYRYLNVKSNDCILGSADKKSIAMSVRCIRK